MGHRFLTLAIGMLVAAAAGVVWAQTPNTPAPGTEGAKPDDASTERVRPSSDRAQQLDRLFQALKIAPDTESAKYIENRIWTAWLTSGSDTTNLLMGRVKTAMENRDLDLAIKLLNAIIDFRPDYAEAWNRRAMIHYMKRDFDRSLADLREVLAREPRHFGALAGIGVMLQEVGDEKHALDAFRRALSLYPHLERIPGLVRNIPEIVKKLGEKIDGRDI